MESEQLEKEYFEFDRRDRCHGFGFRRNMKTFNSIAKLISIVYNPKRVLDIGCAKGFLVSGLRDVGIDAYGIDRSSYALSQNKRHRKFLHVVDVGSDRFPFKNNFFDLITCFETIEHVNNHNHLLKECHRILKKGGRLIISTPKDNYIWFEDKTHINVHEPAFWKKAVIKNGFGITQTYSGLHSLFSALLNGKIKKDSFQQLLKVIPYLKEIIDTHLEVGGIKDFKATFRAFKEFFITYSFFIEAQKI